MMGVILHPHASPVDAWLLIRGGIVALLAIVIIALIMWGLKRRASRTAIDLPAVPAERGEVLARSEALYLDTAKADSPLDRVTGSPLGFRSKSTVEVSTAGVLIDLAEGDLYIPAERIAGTERTSVAGRAVEPGGILAIVWQHPERGALVTSLRIVDHDERENIHDAVGRIAHPISTTPDGRDK